MHQLGTKNQVPNFSQSSFCCGHNLKRKKGGKKKGSRRGRKEERMRNERGRPLCKVIACGKTEQAHNDGFCRTHFNQFVVEDDLTGVDGMQDPWTCSCGKQWPQCQKRCGNTKCQKVSVSCSSVSFAIAHLSSY